MVYVQTYLLLKYLIRFVNQYLFSLIIFQIWIVLKYYCSLHYYQIVFIMMYIEWFEFFNQVILLCLFPFNAQIQLSFLILKSYIVCLIQFNNDILMIFDCDSSFARNSQPRRVQNTRMMSERQRQRAHAIARRNTSIDSQKLRRSLHRRFLMNPRR